MSSNKSIFGLDENVASALCYILGPITGIIAYAMEKENKTVRFHALQSIVTIGLLWVIGTIISVIPIIRLLSGIVGLITLACVIFLAFMAFSGNRFKVPMIGDAVEKTVGL